MSEGSLCGDHPEEKLRFVCVPCDTLVCRECKLTDHEGHRTVDVTKAAVGLKEKLEHHRSRLEQRLSVLEGVIAEVEEDQTAAARAQHRVEERIKNRVAKVTSWLREAEDSALSVLNITAMKVDSDLSSTSLDLDRRRDEVKEMIASVSQVAATFDQPDKFDPIAVLRLEQDMRTGRGNGENLERLTEGLPTYSVRPTLHSDADGLTEAMVRRFIGPPLYTQVTKTKPKVALSPLFGCCSVSGACVSAICPMPNGSVWVAHDVVEGSSAEQRVALYSSEGKVLREQKVGGRVSIARAYGDWVYVSGPNVKKVMDGQETREAVWEKSSSKKGHQQHSTPRYASYALCKRDIRYSVRDPRAEVARDSVICALEVRTLPSLWIVSQAAFSIAAHLPQALDVDSTGQYFAVLVPQPAVQLHRPSQPDPVAVYSPLGENFSPADVCFHDMDGTEVLLVADWFNNAVHVLGFKDGFRFQGYLGAGCPLMMQPTALTSDDDNRLWIGCKGGQILVCVLADDCSDEHEYENSAEKNGDREKGVV